MWRLNEELKNELMEDAKGCENFDEFKNSQGWADWMNDFVKNWTDEQLEDGDEPSDKTIDLINSVLLEVYNKAHDCEGE